MQLLCGTDQSLNNEKMYNIVDDDNTYQRLSQDTAIHVEKKVMEASEAITPNSMNFR